MSEMNSIPPGLTIIQLANGYHVTKLEKHSGQPEELEYVFQSKDELYRFMGSHFTLVDSTRNS